MAYGKGLLSPWELHLKIGLYLSVALCLFFFVAVNVPMGWVALLGLLLASRVWKPITITDPTLGTYIPGTRPYKVAAFFMVLKNSSAMVLTPVVALGFGPPTADPDHGHHEPSLLPPMRLSAYWCALLALPLGALEWGLSWAHYPVWGGPALPWMVSWPLSSVGFFATLQVILAVRRLQGSPGSLGSPEPMPATMVSRSAPDLPWRDLLIRSGMYGAAPTVVLLLVWAVAKWPWWVTAVLGPVLLFLTAAISASRMLQRAYIEAWKQRIERRELWSATFSFLRDVPSLVSEVDLPTREEWAKTIDPNDPDPAPYVPIVKCAMFNFAPATTFEDYRGKEKQIVAALGVENCAIAPIGQAGPDGQEQPGTISAGGFRVWWTEQPLPSLLDPQINHWMREFLCRSVLIPILSEIKGIGPCSMVSARMVTKATSGTNIIKVNVVPQVSGVTVENFLGNLPEIERRLNVKWARAGVESMRGTTGAVVCLYLGDPPTAAPAPSGPSSANAKTTHFVNPAKRERAAIDKMDWNYIFHSVKLAGTTGVPTLIERRPTTSVVDKLVFALPPGLSFEEIKNRASSLRTTSGNTFMEIEQGDDKFAKMTEAERINAQASQSSRFTLIAAKSDPLERTFPFGKYTDTLLTGREPGVAKIDWSPGILADDQPAWDSWSSADAPHLLVAGASGSGKSVVMSSLILQLAFNNGPSECRFWMVEPKSEMQIYRHLDVVERFVDSWSPNENFIPNVADMMEDAVVEMNRRNRAFVSHKKQPKNLFKAREVATNESKANGTPLEDHPLYFPFIFIILEECASLFADSASKEEKAEQARLVVATAEIARKARSAGIFLITATQYPTNASIPSVIRQQMRRIGMRCQNTIASMVVIDQGGLELIRTLGVGQIMNRQSYRNFRGYWVQDGDVDHGKPNDIVSTIKNLPGGGGGEVVEGQVVSSTSAYIGPIVIPEASPSIFTLWDSGAAGARVRDAVAAGVTTKDRDDDDIDTMIAAGVSKVTAAEVPRQAVSADELLLLE